MFFSNKGFAAVYDQLVDPEVGMDRLVGRLRGIGDFSDDLLQAMRVQLEEKNWSTLSRLVHATFLSPSRKLTPFLCDLLDNHRYDGYMEAIADALIDIRDERAVPSIIRALDYELWSDQDSHFNRNLIVALQRIGTEEAIEGIRLALSSPKELIREDAEDALLRLGRA